MTRARILADYVSSGDELALKAPIAGPTFTGTVAIPNVANLETAVVANTAKVTNYNQTLADINALDVTELGTVTSGNLSNSAIVYPDGHIVKWEQVTTIPTASQGAHTAYTDLTGSSVSYTPATGASYVVYEYTTTFQGDTVDANALPLFWFNYDGSTVANTNHSIFTEAGASWFGLGYKSFKFILPAWSGAKTISISYRAYSGSYNPQIHKSLYSGEATSTSAYTKIYQSTYSVM
jgi:hypothetical protein